MTRTGSRPPLRMWLLLGLLLTGLLAAAIVVTELVLRTRYADNLYAAFRRHPPHPFLQLTPASEVDHVNAAGFRGDAVTIDKQAGALRVFAIGGSTTLGVANPYPDSYPAQLQALLADRHPGVRVEVQNAGASWYTTAHNLVNYTLRVRRYRPDVVVVFEAINDITRSFSPPWWAVGEFQPDYSHYLGPTIRFGGPGVEFSRPGSWLVVDALRQLVRHEPSPYDSRDPANVAAVAARMHAVDRPDFKSLPSYREYLTELLRVIRQDGTAVVVGSQASLYRPDLSNDERAHLYFAPLFCADHGTYPSVVAMSEGMRQYNAAAKAIADHEGATWADFSAAVPKNLDHFQDDVHLTRKGNAIVAKLAADAIDGLHLPAIDGRR